MTEKTIQCTTVFDGRLLKVDKLDVERVDGKRSVREIVRHPGEDALFCAKREVEEETGYTVDC